MTYQQDRLVLYNLSRAEVIQMLSADEVEAKLVWIHGTHHQFPSLDLGAIRESDASGSAVLYDDVLHLSMSEELAAVLHQDLVGSMGYLMCATLGEGYCGQRCGETHGDGTYSRVIDIICASEAESEHAVLQFLAFPAIPGCPQMAGGED